MAAFWQLIVAAFFSMLLWYVDSSSRDKDDRSYLFLSLQGLVILGWLFGYLGFTTMMNYFVIELVIFLLYPMLVFMMWVALIS